MAKESSAKKLHVEVTLANWSGVEKYIENYNSSPDRRTPKIKPAHVINIALDEYLTTKIENSDGNSK